jgi:GAF domain-containing protein
VPKGTQRKLPREKAKEILGEVDSTLSSLSQQRARQSVVKLLNRVPTYSWVGIYLMKGSELVLDAWSGPQATEHVKIPLGKGVCGFAAKSGKTEIVADVTKDSRYLQCFANTKSEIVVPILETGKVLGEIDVDSDVPDAFSSVDKEFLEAVAVKLSPHCPSAQSRPDS